jgi:hypothetical protein
LERNSVIADEAERRRRTRSLVIRLTLFAVAVYVAFIVTFVSRHT